MGDFVRPEPQRLTLSDGKFIDIRKRLTHGETEDMYTRMSPHADVLNRREVRTAKILAYLIGWSLTDDDGTPVPMTPTLPEHERIDTIRSLDPDRAVEIHQAIEAHEEAIDKARATQKKILSGSPNGGATSISPSGVTGASSGFEHSLEMITTF